MSEWIKVKNSDEFPEYRQGYVWKTKLKSGRIYWTAFTRFFKPPANDPVVSYYSKPCPVNKKG